MEKLKLLFVELVKIELSNYKSLSDNMINNVVFHFANIKPFTVLSFDEWKVICLQLGATAPNWVEVENLSYRVYVNNFNVNVEIHYNENRGQYLVIENNFDAIGNYFSTLDSATTAANNYMKYL